MKKGKIATFLCIISSTGLSVGAMDLDNLSARSSSGIGSQAQPDIWTEIGMVKSGAIRLPVWLHFSPHIASPVLPSGWYLPIMESSVVQVSEYRMLAKLPNGEGQMLIVSKLDPAQWSSDTGWLAEVKNKNVVLMKGSDRYEFHSGKLCSVKQGDDTLVWTYDRNGRLAEIRDGSGASLLKVQQNGEGIDRELVLGGAGSPMKLGYFSVTGIDPGDFKKSTGMMGSQLNRIESPLFNPVTIEQRIENGRMNMVWHCDGTEKLNRQLSWDDVSNRLETFNGRAVEVYAPADTENHPQIILRGPSETVVVQRAISVKPGVETVYSSNQVERRRYYAVLPTGEQVIRRQSDFALSNNGQQPEAIEYKSRYDKNGALIMDQRGAFKRVLENGKYLVYRDGKLLREY